jgi:hypothetical protein
MSKGFCTTEQMEQCPLTEHFTDTHHLYFPQAQYKRPIERAYRELPPHKVQMCRNDHNELHEAIEPPTKPPVTEMQRAIASWAMRELEIGA